MDAQNMPKTSLWGAEEQSLRLAELTAPTDERAKEAPLRRDVRSLGVLLARVLVDQVGEPVFTAHPTEVARRTVLTKRRRIAKCLELLDRLPLSGSEALEIENAIAAEITALWQTDEVRVQRPQVTDEIRMGLDHYPMSIFESLPRLYAEIRESFKDVYDVELCAEQVPQVLSFGSWIGGDRDGNPFV